MCAICQIAQRIQTRRNPINHWPTTEHLTQTIQLNSPVDAVLQDTELKETVLKDTVPADNDSDDAPLSALISESS